MTALENTLRLAAAFGIVALAGISLVFIHDFILRGLSNRRARLTEEARNATN